MKSLLSNPLTVFIAQALVLIGLARAIGVVARRLRQPMVVAEMLAGIALGPSLLGWLAPGVHAALFPRESLGMLGHFSQVGLLLFMFLVGLEFDPQLLRGRARASVAISHASIALPFALGAALASYLYPRISSWEAAPAPFASFALFMGAAMSITAFPVLARILIERGLMRSRIGAIALACAAVDDVTAWCILAFVVAIVRAAGIGPAVRTTALAAGYVVFVLFALRPLLARFAARGIGVSQNVFALALGLLLVSSWITELIGVHALFGAFLMGAAIPKERELAATLAKKLEDVVVVFLLPLFFAHSGLRTRVGLIDRPEMWIQLGLILLVACAGKFGGSAIAARVTGLDWREASAIGVLMNTRGLMELVVLNLGLDLGVIPPGVFTMMVLMAMVTTIATTPLIQWIHPARLAADGALSPATR